MTIIQCSALQIQEKMLNKIKLYLLDVREPDEFAYAQIENSVLIPLGQLPYKVDELDKKDHIVVICHHGVRSLQACLILENAGFEHLYNLKGGIDSWSLLCDPLIPRY